MWVLHTRDERFFTPEEHKQVELLLETILPGTSTSPGATDANAAEYLDRLLAMDDSTYYELPGWRNLYKSALPALAAAAEQLHGTPLVQLSSDQRNNVIAKLQQGALPGMEGIDQRVFFNVLRSHCLEGCFADPRWGGNLERVMWRWYGYLQPARPFKRPQREPQERVAAARGRSSGH